MSIVVGVDIAKESFAVCLWRENGQKKRAEFANSASGHEELCAWIGPALTEAHFVMEASGSYHMALARYLTKCGAPVSIVHPARASFFARVEGVRNKTDRADAQMLAQYGAKQQPAVSRMKEEERVELKGLVRYRERLGRQIAKERTRLKDPEMPSFVREETKETLEFLKEKRRRIERKIRELLASHPKLKEQEGRLRSIPGFGEVVAWTILSELPPVEELASAKQAAAYVGVCPKERTSGSSVRGRTRLSKMGNRTLRRALYMPAISLLRTEGEFRRLYDRLQERGKTKMCGVGAVMHKMVRVAFGVLRTESSYKGS